MRSSEANGSAAQYFDRVAEDRCTLHSACAAHSYRTAGELGRIGSGRAAVTAIRRSPALPSARRVAERDDEIHRGALGREILPRLAAQLLDVVAEDAHLGQHFGIRLGDRLRAG